MGAKSDLLDAAKKVCLSDAETARRLGVSRSNVSSWRHDVYPMPDHQVIATAKIARENPAYWLSAVAAEQSAGAVRKAWEMAAAALPRVAMIAIVFGSIFAHYPAAAQNMNDGLYKHYAKLREICANFTRWLAASLHGYRPSALLA